MIGSDSGREFLFREAVIPLAWYDPDGGLIDANPASLSVFGVDSVDAIRGYSLFDDPFLPDPQKKELRAGNAIVYEVTVDFTDYRGEQEIHSHRSGKTRFLSRITPVRLELPAGTAGFLVQLVELAGPGTDMGAGDLADAAEPGAGTGTGLGTAPQDTANVAAPARERERRGRSSRRRADREPDLYRLLADNSEDVISLFGSDLVPLFISPAIYRLTGYSVQELLRPVPSALILEEDRGRVIEEIRAAFSSGSLTHRTVYRVRRKDGQQRWVESRSRRIDLADGDWQIVSVNRDITETEELRHELEASKARVEDLLEQTRLLHRESLHRMKNDIALVSALLGMQARSADDPKVRGPILDASSRVSVIAELYRSLDPGPGGPSHGIRTFVGAILNGLRRSILPDTVELDWSAPEGELPARTLTAVGLIMNELVTNAVKHGVGPDGHGRIGVAVTLDHSWIRVRVSDSGPGLPDGITSGEGMGIGLQLLHTLAEHHKGRVVFGAHAHGTTGGTAGGPASVPSGGSADATAILVELPRE